MNQRTNQNSGECRFSETLYLMKALFHCIVLFLQLYWAFPSIAVEVQTLTKAETEMVRSKLEDYESGKLSLEEATEFEGEVGNQKIIAYHLLYASKVTPKQQLPISRCYALAGNYTVAAELAKTYLNTYSNDWQGWSTLGGAKAMLKLNHEALAAMTNVVRLGSDQNITALGVMALTTERLDVFESMVLKRLLILKDLETNNVNNKLTQKLKLEMVTVLVGYSLKANKKEVFTQALENVSLAQVRSVETLKCYVEAGCELFKAKETASICAELAGKDQDKK